jgi:DnaK suppressor protein
MMEIMPRSRSAEFELLLRARRDELRAALSLNSGELDGILAARSDAVADDEHDPEGSTLSSDWSRLVGMRGATLARLAEVDRALERLADGSYGTCSTCGREIPLPRLRVRPEARLCVGCAG